MGSRILSVAREGKFLSAIYYCNNLGVYVTYRHIQRCCPMQKWWNSFGQLLRAFSGGIQNILPQRRTSPHFSRLLAEWPSILRRLQPKGITPTKPITSTCIIFLPIPHASGGVCLKLKGQFETNPSGGKGLLLGCLEGVIGSWAGVDDFHVEIGFIIHRP